MYPFDVIKVLATTTTVSTSPTTGEASTQKLIKATATATATLNLTKQEISKIL